MNVYYRRIGCLRLRKGFTIVELLIVIAILSVLSSLVMITFPGAGKGARDSRRRQELGQYRVALENYANKSGGIYPDRPSNVKPNTLCGVGQPLGNVPCPLDPKDGASGVCVGGTCQYQYRTSGGGVDYTLWARLEKPVSTTAPCFVIHSNGVSGEEACP